MQTKAEEWNVLESDKQEGNVLKATNLSKCSSTTSQNLIPNTADQRLNV